MAVVTVRRQQLTNYVAQPTDHRQQAFVVKLVVEYSHRKLDKAVWATEKKTTIGSVQHAVSWSAYVMVIQFDKDTTTKPCHAKSCPIEATPTNTIRICNIRARHFTRNAPHFCKLIYWVLLELMIVQGLNGCISYRPLPWISSFFLCRNGR